MSVCIAGGYDQNVGPDTAVNISTDGSVLRKLQMLRKFGTCAAGAV